MESFSAIKNRARVAAGIKGGDQFRNPMTMKEMSFTGWPSEVDKKFQESGTAYQGKPVDVWNARRANGSI